MMKIFVLFCLALGMLAGQTFEMALVRASPHSDNPSLRVFRRDGRYELLGATMVDLIATAYGVKADAVTRGPSWLEADRFDVIAKIPADSTPEARKIMLRALLADRFGLVVRSETSLRPAYLLTAGARPKIKQAAVAGDGACEDKPELRTAAMNGVLSCRTVTMAAFANVLRTSTLNPVVGYVSGLEVVDQTGLKGSWDFDITWSGRGLLPRLGSDGVTLFDAVDKQLGLRLERGNAPLPVIAVESVSRKPTDNLPGVTEKLPELKLEFDVVSIKPSTQPGPTAPKFTPGGGLDVRGVALIALIQHAWGIDSYDDELIVGGPKWLSTERFDLLAKATPPDGPSSALKDDDSLRAMLRNMLIDRFRLAIHPEEKQATVYTLVGEKLKLRQADPSGRSKCTEGPADASTAAGVAQRIIRCTHTTAAQFAERIRGMAPGSVRRPVIDETGVSEAWDFSVIYAAPNAIRAAIVRGDGQAGGGAAEPDGVLSLFEALERQTGLRLVTAKRAVPVLVVEHVEQKPAD